MKTILLIAFVLALAGAFIASAADDAAAEAKPQAVVSVPIPAK